MAKVVVENVNVEIKEEMMPMVIVGKEMMSLVKNLPDWGKEVRRMMAKKYKGYKYWRDGVRIDEDFYLMRKEGNRQWFLVYTHYRICGKEKRTRFRTVLYRAYCVDSMGRIGKYVNEDPWGGEIKEYGIAFRSCNRSFKMPSGEEDVIEALKYSCLANMFQEMSCMRLERLMKFSAMYIRFPQVEFICKMEDNDLRETLIGRLINIFEREEFQELKDWINIIRLCVKHKFHLFVKKRKNVRFDYHKMNYWWDYVLGIRMLGKDWRNPHYLCPVDIKDAHDRVMIKLRKKFPDPVEVKVQIEFERLKRRYVGLVFEEGDLKIMTLDSPQAYREESRAMHNCIEALKYYIKPSSLILCARLKGKRIADIELSLNEYSLSLIHN